MNLTLLRSRDGRSFLCLVAALTVSGCLHGSDGDRGMQFIVLEFNEEMAEEYGGDVPEDAEVVDCDDPGLRNHEVFSDLVDEAVEDDGSQRYTERTESIEDPWGNLQVYDDTWAFVECEGEVYRLRYVRYT